MKKIAVVSSLLVLLSTSSMAGEQTQFFRDPISREKHFRARSLYDKLSEGVRSIKDIKKDSTGPMISVESFVLKSINVSEAGSKKVDNAKFKYISSPYVGKAVDDKEVTAIVRKVKSHYIKGGFLLPVVEVSGQDSGVLNLSVMNGKIRDVELVVDKKHEKEILNNELLKRYIDHILESSPAKTKEIQRQLLLINKIPGYEAKYELQAIKSGSKAANDVADLVLEVKRSKVKLELDVTNHGISDLGRYQGSAFAQVCNPTKHNDSLIVSLGTSNKPNRMSIATLGYLKRLNSLGTSVSVLGSHSTDNSYKAQRLSAKDDHSNTLRGQVSHYLVLNNKNSVRLDVGLDYRAVKEYNTTQVTTDYDYTMGFVGAQMKHKDFLGADNHVNPSLFYTLGDAHLHRTTASTTFDKNFTFFTLDYFRDQPLPNNFSLFTQVIWHNTQDDLPVEQQFFVGGNTIGRGYKSGLISSEKGINGDIELRYTYEVGKGYLNTMQVFGFYDISKFSRTSATVNKKALSSAGAGVRFFMPNGFRADFEVAVPHTKHVTVGGVAKHNPTRYQFLVGKSFTW